jgi:hypothetical protein
VKRALVVVPLLLVLAACGSGGGGSKLGSVTSAQQVVDYMAAHGVPCTGVDPNRGVIGVREEVSCTVDGQNATIDVWNSNEQRDQISKAFDSLASGATVNGDKWSVSVDTDAEAHKIADAIGGSVH